MVNMKSEEGKRDKGMFSVGSEGFRYMRMLIKLNGIAVELESEHSQFVTFAEDHFRDFISHEYNDCDIKIRFTLDGESGINENSDEFGNINELDKIGRRLLIGYDQVVILELTRFPGLKIKFKISGSTLSAFGLFQVQQSEITNIFNRFRRGKGLRAKELFFLLYYLIYFPIFWYLERYKGLYLLHASAVQMNNKGIVFSGLGGVGKSTLTLATLSYPDSKFLSDNLIFFDDQKVYACFEQISLDQRSMNLLQRVSEKLERTEFIVSHGRRNYRVRQDMTIDATEPQKLFLLRLAKETYVSPISPLETAEKLLAINQRAHEVEEYYNIAAALSLAFPEERLHHKKSITLERFLSNVQCYELGMKIGMDLQQVLEKTVYRIV